MNDKIKIFMWGIDQQTKRVNKKIFALEQELSQYGLNSEKRGTNQQPKKKKRKK